MQCLTKEKNLTKYLAWNFYLLLFALFKQIMRGKIFLFWLSSVWMSLASRNIMTTVQAYQNYSHRENIKSTNNLMIAKRRGRGWLRTKKIQSHMWSLMTMYPKLFHTGHTLKLNETGWCVTFRECSKITCFWWLIQLYTLAPVISWGQLIKVKMGREILSRPTDVTLFARHWEFK
jgi:hypothetical protein